MKTAIFAIVILCGGLAVADQQAVAPPAPAALPSNEQQRKNIWDESIRAGTNARYWSALATDTSDAERRWFYFAAVSAVVTVVLPSALRHIEKTWVRCGFEILAGAGLFVSIAGAYSNGTNYRELSVLERRWGALATDWNQLFDSQPNLDDKTVQSKIDSLVAKRIDIESFEPGGENKQLFDSMQDLELHSRGLDDWLKEHGRSVVKQ
jgi:hypothetical protein